MPSVSLPVSSCFSPWYLFVAFWFSSWSGSQTKCILCYFALVLPQFLASGHLPQLQWPVSLLWKPKSVGGFPQAVVCGSLFSSGSQHVLMKPVEQQGEGDQDGFLRGVNPQVPQSIWKVSFRAPLYHELVLSPIPVSARLCLCFCLEVTEIIAVF